MDAPPSPPGTSESHLHRGWTPHPEQGADLVGLVLAERFEIGARIGRGGMASVHVCRDLALHGLAAVKILRDNNADARRRFADEARILANLRSPHLVQVLAVGEMDDRAPYMVLEHLKGESLQARLRQRGPLPWREVVESAIQIALALEALHRVHVIHRDIKPSNVIAVESASGRLIVKLIDLGIAKVHDWSQVQEGRSRRRRGIRPSTGWSSALPASSAGGGRRQADPRFDVYGLGVTIYLLCTGVAPTPGETVSMRERRPEAGVPAELDALVQAALASDPHRGSPPPRISAVDSRRSQRPTPRSTERPSSTAPSSSSRSSAPARRRRSTARTTAMPAAP
ncbi:MAG: serine/threonine-protein kinase [Nannocystaceae bacterium]